MLLKADVMTDCVMVREIPTNVVSAFKNRWIIPDAWIVSEKRAMGVVGSGGGGVVGGGGNDQPDQESAKLLSHD